MFISILRNIGLWKLTLNFTVLFWIVGYIYNMEGEIICVDNKNSEFGVLRTIYL